MRTKLRSFKLLAFSMVLCLLHAGTGFSQTTKTTKQDGPWSDPATWTGGIIPDASNKATINNHVNIDMDVNILSLTINAASSLTFDTTAAHVFTVADEIVDNGLFTVATNKVSPLKHTVEVGADFYGPGFVDFYDPKGDVVELVFIGNSNSLLKDIQDVTGVGGNGKFGGIIVDKSLTSAVVTLQKSLTINSGASPALQCNATVKKGILDFDSCAVSAGDNTNALIVDSLGKLYIASIPIHSGDSFEQYSIHHNSTVKFYNDGDYEMTKGWTAFDGEFGNLFVSGKGTKFFGDSVVMRGITGDFTIEAGANYNVDNDSVIIHGLVSINGILSSDNKPSYILFDSLVYVADNGGWKGATNDWYVFKNGLNVSKKADFSCGSGIYAFTTRDQKIILHDTIQNILIDAVNLLNEDSLTCEVMRGTGTLTNHYYFDFAGQTLACNLGLDSANNKVVYSNSNPQVSSFSYENLEIRSTGTASLMGNVTVRNSLIKDNDGYVSLGDYNLTMDTLALLKFVDPTNDRMIATDGSGSLVVRSKTADRFMMTWPVGTLADTAYTPFEITNIIKHPGGTKYLSAKAIYGHHPGMEDTTGLLKYWTIKTDMLPADSISADIRLLYADREVVGVENNYEVRCWTGDEPWIEPDAWNLDPAINEILVKSVHTIALDWTAGDSTAITSKIDPLVFSVDSGILFNAQLLSVTTTTPDVNIFYTIDGTIPYKTDSLYSDPVAVDSSMTLSAIAYKEGWQNSDVTTASYTFKVDTVRFNKASGTYTGKQSIILTSNTLNAEIRYTIDGSDPNDTTALYTSPVEIDTAITIKAIGYKDKYLPTSISTANYIIVYDTVDAPEFSIAGGTYFNEIAVVITTDTLNTKIYFAYGDTIPDITTGKLYTVPLSINGSYTINAIAYKDNLIESDVASVLYTFQVDNVKFSKPSGTYEGIQSIELSTSTVGAVIHYTLNGTDPDSLSPVYASPLEIDATITLKAIGYKEKYLKSSISESNYTITIESSISETVENAAISIYPVPAVNTIKINLGKTYADVALSLFDIGGGMIYYNSFKSTDLIELNLSGYEAGTYFIKLGLDSQIVTRKLIKE